MKVQINLSNFSPDWNSHIIDKVWYFRDLLIFYLGGLIGWKESGYETNGQTMQIDFNSTENARRAIACLNNQKGISAVLV